MPGTASAKSPNEGGWDGWETHGKRMGNRSRRDRSKLHCFLLLCLEVARAGGLWDVPVEREMSLLGGLNRLEKAWCKERDAKAAFI